MRMYLRILPVAVLLLACQTVSNLQSIVSSPTASTPSGQDSVPVDTQSVLPSVAETSAPADTVAPSPTAVQLPDAVNNIVSGASVKYQDTFDASSTGSSPKGWMSCDNNTTWGFLDGVLSISNDDGNGTTYYYGDGPITPKEGVYFLFQYVGKKGSITFGFDSYRNGKPCGGYLQNGYYSVAMELADSVLSAHSIKNAVQKNSKFTGKLTLLENTWYGLVLGYDENDTYFITIWDRTNAGQTLVFRQTYANFPKSYNFIGYMAATRSLKMDDFTIFTFDSIQ